MILLFDIFGTLVDMTSVPRQEIKAYIETIRKPEWEPLVLPLGWGELNAFPDVVEGFARLKQQHRIVAMSNAPVNMAHAIANYNGFGWDAVIPLEAVQVYKPNPRAYQHACNYLNVAPAHCMMITANKDFGDIEGAGGIGMQTKLIRSPLTLIDLAEELGC